MNTTLRIRGFVAAVATLIGTAQQIRATPPNTSFTYQGELKQSGLPYEGPIDLSFTLWDAPGAGNPPAGGNMIGLPVEKPGTPIGDGLFTVQLNELNEFGATAFMGDARWLQINVNGTLLAPRQPITAAPYALGLRPGTRVEVAPSLGIELANPSTQMGIQAWSPNYALYGGATGSGVGVFGGGHYGVWGQGNAMGVRGIGLTPASWAAYFEGKSFFSDRVGIGTEAPNAELEVSSSCQLGPCPDLLRLTTLFDGANSRTLVLNSSSINATGSSSALPLYVNDQTAGHVVLANGGGKVGIGVWPPTQKLDVAGMIRSGQDGFMFPDGTVQTTAASGGPNFWSPNGDDISNNNVGSVGIGLPNPTARLGVMKDANNSAIYAQGSVSILKGRDEPGSGLSISRRYEFGRSTTMSFDGEYLDAWSSILGDPGSSHLFLNHTSSGNVLLAGGGGSVGIGTAEPDAKLEVVSESNDLLRLTHLINFGGAATLVLNASSINTSATLVAPDLRLNDASPGDVLLANGGGSVGIATSTIPAGVKLAVDGKVLCEELEVQLSGDWPDFVFDADYARMSLPEIDRFVKSEKHLPDVPSAADVKQNGVAVGQMQAKLLQKIEELTLHLIDQHQQIEVVRQDNAKLRERIACLEHASR